jgi:hypothetical protein
VFKVPAIIRAIGALGYQFLDDDQGRPQRLLGLDESALMPLKLRQVIVS